MASVYTPNLGLELPARNDYKGTWDVPNNANFMAIDAVVGGTITVAIGNGTTTLSKTQSQAASIVFTGALSAPATVQLASGVGGVISVLNGTTGNQTVVLQTASGGAAVGLGAGFRTLVVSDGANISLADQSGTPPGAVLPFLGASVPGGFLLAYGQSVSRATYAALFAVFGSTYGAGDGANTFGIPDLRGCALAGLDNMGGAAANRLNLTPGGGAQLGAVVGEQQHTLALFEMPTHNHTIPDPGHDHGINDPKHTHSYVRSSDPNTGSGAGAVSNGGNYSTITEASSTGITIKKNTTGIVMTDANGQSQSHNNVQPTMLCNWIVKT